jgi:WD40 repeat protein
MLVLFCVLVLQDSLNDKDTRLMDSPKDRKLLEISPDGRQAACCAEQAGKHFVFDQRGRSDAWDQTSLLTFGPKGRRLGYHADRGKEQFVVVDGATIGPVARVHAFGIVFSPDEAHWAFMTFDEDAEKEAVYLDGKKFDEFEIKREDLPNSLFTTDGKLIYRRVRIQDGQRRHHLIVDGRAVSPGYDSIGWITMSPDGKRLAYKASRGEGEFFVLDGAELKSYRLVSGFTFSPDSRRYAYMGDNERATAVVDGEEVETQALHFVDHFTFSPDAKRVAYVIQPEPDRWSHVVLDGKQGPRFENAHDLSFSPDSKRFAYSVQDGGDRRAVIDGRKGRAFAWTEPVLFTPDSQHAVYLARDNSKTYLVLDHKVIRTFEHAEGLRVFPDGKRVGLGTVEGGQIWWRVISID